MAVVGEIYVRCDPFANDFVIDKLEKRGIRAHLAPFNEWLEYADWCMHDCGRDGSLGSRLSRAVLHRTQQLTYNALARRLGWHSRTRVKQALEAADPYLRDTAPPSPGLPPSMSPLHEPTLITMPSPWPTSTKLSCTVEPLVAVAAAAAAGAFGAGLPLAAALAAGAGVADATAVAATPSAGVWPELDWAGPQPLADSTSTIATDTAARVSGRCRRRASGLRAGGAAETTIAASNDSLTTRPPVDARHLTGRLYTSTHATIDRARG